MVLLDAAGAALPTERVIVATFDHGTGDAATHAADLVARRSATLGIECDRRGGLHSGRSEAELRSARWEFLTGVAARANARVATAHTADDQIETVLMRTLRDSGARGLAGLAADSRVLRPMLDFRRREVEEYARERALDWVEDPSNRSMRFFRNRIRHELLPALRAAQPGIDECLLQIGFKAADWRRDVDRVIDDELDVRVLREVVGLDVRAETLQRYSVFELRELLPAVLARAGAVLDRRGIVRLAEFVRRSQVGACADLSGDWKVVRSRDALQLRASTDTPPTPKALALSESTSWSVWRFSPMRDERVNDQWRAWLPATRPLTVRAWRHGDMMVAGATRRTRKVKELLSKAGITGHDRASWPVVVAGDDILWIPGVRRSETPADSATQPGLSFVCEYLDR